ncbi:MAG: TadE/TadG family type IV pilus assembly protein [Pseudomonadota bacterium]
MIDLSRWFRNYSTSNTGNVAFALAVSLLPILSLIGVALDIRRASNMQSALQDVLDAGSLAGGRTLQLGKSDDDIKAAVRAFAVDFFEDNANRLNCGQINVVIDRVNNTTTSSVDCTVPTTVASVMGFSQLDIDAESEARFDIEDVDVSFVLDMSGSMTNAKLSALRDAATSAVEILIPDLTGPSSNLRIAFAPYSHAVNAGAFFEDLTDEAVAREFPREVLDDGATCSDPGDCLDELQDEGLETVNAPFSGTCFWERGGPEAFTDAPPGNNAYLSPGDPVWFFDANDQDKAQGLAGITTGAPGGFFQLADNTALNMRYAECQPAEILPLSDNRSEAISYIETLTERGRGTNGALGIAAGWYLISDDWRDVWPNGSKPHLATENVSKFIIVMTDGIFDDWRLDTATYGDQEAQALQMCDAVKNEDITIFTVSFEAPAAAEALLAQCATSSNTAFVSNNAAELEEDFQEIARQIRPLRISR